MVIEDEEDLVENYSRERTLTNINNYYLKSAIFNWAALWKAIKIMKIMKLPQSQWFEVSDFHRILQRAGDTEDASPCLEEKGDPRYQVLTGEIVN